MNEIICRNCNNTATGNFCSTCGQSTKTGRINLHNIVHNFLHGILHVDQGFFYTMKELTIRPGKTIRDYFAGKRVSYFNPFGYLFLLTTVYVFISHFAGLPVFLEMKTEIQEVNEHTKYIESILQTARSVMDNHYSLIMLCSIPIISLGTLLFFRAAKYNYGEHLMMNCYIWGHQIILNILFIPIGYIWGTDLMFQSVTQAQVLLIAYMTASVFNSYKLWKRIVYPICVQTLLTILIVFVIIVAIILLMMLRL